MNSPVILVDSRLPEEVLTNLYSFGEVLKIPEHSMVYPAIAAHPDIFFCKVDNTLVFAPGINPELITRLSERGIKLVRGDHNPSPNYPLSVKYNAVITPNWFIHLQGTADRKITELCKDKMFIAVNQGYTRCSLLPLNDHFFITSDKGIEKTLLQRGLKVFFYPPEDILLEGMKYGFIGGCAGIDGNMVLFTGTPSNVQIQKQLEQFLATAGMTPFYLSEKPMIDGGSIIIIHSVIS